MGARPLRERLPIVDFPAAADAALLPARLPEAEPYEKGLAGGRLRLQACAACARLRFPIAPVCPYCGGEAAGWRSLTGRGSVLAWVRYHRAYVPAFEPLVPYSVLTVQLDEGPRLFGRLADQAIPRAGLRVRTIVERWPAGRHVPAFVAEDAP